MQQINYERFQETLYYDQMPNGLSVFILPKRGFKKTYAVFSTKYGSIDNHFQVEGEAKLKVPDGVAHFLEHKMFEEPTGDIFAQFAAQGASANAFTSFDRTAYLFSATEQIENNIETLLNFVQNPYFTDENVEKEKGIIGQEINMYKDNPDWQAYFGLIQAMYHRYPIHIDIAGSIESISQITKDTLYDCYHHFYHPSNMNLFIVGGVDPAELMLLVRDNQAKKEFPPMRKISRFFDDEPLEVKQEKRVVRLAVSQPKCLIGIKETDLGYRGNELLVRECQTQLMLSILFGSSSPLYQKLYEEHLINDTFSYEYNANSDYAFSVFGGDTPDPERLVKRLKEEVDHVKKVGISARDFERLRRKRMGGYLRLLNSPEAIANEFTRYRFRDQDFFDLLSVYEEMTLQQVNDRLQQLFDWSQTAISIVRNDDLDE